MATVYTKTDNYGLNLYGDNDPADLRDGYNGSMRTVDTTLKQHLDRIGNTENTVKTLLGDNTTQKATEAKTRWDDAASNATQAKNKADSNAAILTALGAGDTGGAQAIKSKWDTASSDAGYAKNKADSNAAILTALGAGDTGSASASKTKWNKNTTDIAQIFEKLGQDQYSDGFLVTFGDSYADNEQSRTWSYQLSRMLPGLTWKNYAKAGAGFGVPNIATFAQQVQNCVQDSSVDKNKVKVAVCAGGRNDILEYHAAYEKGIECANALQQAFPNAIIVFAPLLFDHKIVDQTTLQKKNGLYNGAFSTAFGNHRFIALDDAYVWCKGNTAWFPETDIHPNESGAKAIARYLYTACHDSYRGRRETSLSNFGAMQVEFKLAGDLIIAQGQGSIPQIGEGTGGELSKWAFPRKNVWAWVVSGGNTTQPTLSYIQPDGKWGFFNPTTSNQGNASFMASYLA